MTRRQRSPHDETMTRHCAPINQAIARPDGRILGFADYGPVDGHPVIWFHGAPGSRFEPEWLTPRARHADLRTIAIDRPGYGLSTPLPGRTIADVVADAITVAEHLAVQRFLTVGTSTGGAYALATAALAPDRVDGVLVCGALTDMAYQPARRTMHGPQVAEVWAASSREDALAVARDAYGSGFTKLLDGGMNAVLSPSDDALFRNPTWMTPAMHSFHEMRTHGHQGYVDDRIADGHGWHTFDVDAISCQVIVLHGDADRLCPVIHAHHTAQLVPTAELVIVPDAGHFSIEQHVIPTLTRLMPPPRAPQLEPADTASNEWMSAGARDPEFRRAARGNAEYRHERSGHTHLTGDMYESDVWPDGRATPSSDRLRS